MLKLTGKIGLIAGGAGYLGEAVCRQMTDAGAWASRKIRVNAIAPGPFPSPAVQKEHPEKWPQ